jgi:hypothetical protein
MVALRIVLSWRWFPVLMLRRTAALLLCASVLFGQLTPKQKSDNLESFEIVWRTVRDMHPDPKLNGLDWNAIHASTRPLIENARTTEQVRSILTAMLAKLEVSHYAIIPSGRYQETAEPPAPATSAPQTASVIRDSGPSNAAAPSAIPRQAPAPAAPSAGNAPETPKGNVVRFGNLPEMRVYFESRALSDGVGYLHFNEFLDPGTIVPQFQAALKTFAHAPGIILDLRGNRGGIGLMATGIAGFFIDKPGLSLGEMKTRDSTLKFAVFPRAQTYAGPLAILVDEGSASTTEIFAAGMRDLNRARIFGVRTMGAALPSDIIRLPNGDGFQYPEALYISANGETLEGAGVTPDETVVGGAAGGRDLVIEAAQAWIDRSGSIRFRRFGDLSVSWQAKCLERCAEQAVCSSSFDDGYHRRQELDPRIVDLC